MLSVGGSPPMMASGPPAAAASPSSAMVSSTEWRPVAAATFTNFSTFHRRLAPVEIDIEKAVHPRIGHRRLVAVDGRGTGTSRCVPGPRGARARRRLGRAAASSVLLLRPGPTVRDDVSQGHVEPRGDGRATVGDRTDGSGVAAQPDPAGADGKLGAGERTASGLQRSWKTNSPVAYAASSPGASMPAAKAVTRPSVAPAATRACWAAAWARPRPDGVEASVSVTSRMGPRAGGVVRGRPGPGGIGVQSRDEFPVVREQTFPPRPRTGRSGACDARRAHRSGPIGRRHAAARRRQRRSRPRPRRRGRRRTGPRAQP